ncbi:UDP-3-O-(3-hydroxymyristoyl)glucosamine N-acyltransferase [Tropicimonas isoalkanivorans]|uniref:UDP-3-O-[3-hydroxymyristoyl] glucosamine N-acyltransferase n=1 Tax=Tropicimonas isoalkanivorans TaxID=441112 RepID=A0A1I1DZG9_9RHOB|nr:UDP-3-O-(3-hydroxymyristoyl)glucosamine N-acyltransferase [Tropicimonas isoalkanivorans]SFB78398.1 UDP-3-O-[3-hydroxymyristoyl] glucosamine N-acyltransferase [Tropicimonas isoalkanivorans]
MRFTIEQIAEALGARAVGDLTLEISHASEPADAGPDAIAIAMAPAYAERLKDGSARAAVLWADADWAALGLEAAILIDRPRYALSGLTALLDSGPGIAPGIHPTAVVDDSATIGIGAAVGPFVVIGRGVSIGPRARIAAHVSIADNTTIGADAVIHAGARIGRNVRIGDLFTCQPGASIGGDGFSFVTPQASGMEQARDAMGDEVATTRNEWVKIHSLGGVEIGDDVEVGSNATIDAGTIRATRIGRGTKIDNLVMIGHNVIVGEDCLLCGLSGVAGSTVIGDRVVLAGQAGVADNITIGSDVVITAATKVISNVPSGRVMAGYPAVKMSTHVEGYKALRRLPRLFREVAEVRKVLSKADGSD